MSSHRKQRPPVGRLYEHRSEPLLPRRRFLLRMLSHGGVSFGVVAVALAAGMVGYHVTERLSWLDAFLNASMILSGMGPVAVVTTRAGKLFAGSYALFSGIVVLAAAGLLLAPMLHRLLHRLHIDDEEPETKEE